MSRSRLLLLCLILTACGPVSSSPVPAVSPAPSELVAPTLYSTPTAEQMLEVARAMLPDVGLGPSATLGQPLPLFSLTSEALRAYQPGTPVESVIAPRQQWMMPVLAQGEGRGHMTVGFDAGAWRVVGWVDDPVLARNLALLQQQYADRDAAIRVIGDLGTGNTLALVTEGGREALIVLSDVRSPLPEWRESPLQALPPDQVMRKLLAEACPPGMTC